MPIRPNERKALDVLISVLGENYSLLDFKLYGSKAKGTDVEKWREAIDLEHETMIEARKISKDLSLDMKIGDVEYQGDKKKAIFYYPKGVFP